MIGTKEILVIVFLIMVVIMLVHFIRRRIETRNFREYHSRKRMKELEHIDN